MSTAADLARRFAEMLGGTGGVVRAAAGDAEASAYLQELVQLRGVRCVAHSDCPRVRRILAPLHGRVEILDSRAAKEELLRADLGVTSAQWGIAETGTLVLESAAERHRLVSLLPPLHLALLETGRLLADLDQALQAVAGAGPASMSRAVTFITGPSRTADIELQLVVGVHGPRELHVLLLDR